MIDLTYNLSRQQAAEILGISTRTLDRYIRRWFLSYKKISNRILLSEEEVKAFKKRLDNKEIIHETEVIWWDDVKEYIYDVEHNQQDDYKNKSQVLAKSSNDIEKIVQLLKEKDQIIEQKNKMIFALQHKLGELETKLKTYIALPDYSKEKETFLKEKEKLLEEKNDLILSIKKMKFYNLVLFLIAFIAIAILFLTLSLWLLK